MMAMTPQYMRELLINTAARYEPPTPEELAEAPLLDVWSLEDVDDEDDLPAVIGRVHGHDFAPDGSPMIAGEAFAMDPELAWVRTMSRLYRLGRPEKVGGDDGH
jgi:hypothetical protein